MFPSLIKVYLFLSEQYIFLWLVYDLARAAVCLKTVFSQNI